MARSKPETEIDFGERLRWMMVVPSHPSWYLLCDPKTVSVPDYIKGMAKRTLYIGPQGYWREVDHTKDHKAWQFTDRPGKPIMVKDYLAG